jgi:uncharacterized protein (DUF1015 family)
VPRFEPFPGLRYDPERVALADVTAPPYDVIDEGERDELAQRHERNVVRLDLPVGDDCYGEAGRCLRAWLDEGTLTQDAPSFYGYRMRWRDGHLETATTTGVLGALELSRPGEGGILPHEHTTKKAKTDRLDLLRGARANLSAVWALSPTEGLSDLVRPVDGDPRLWTWTDEADVTHELWVLDDPVVVDAIRDAVAANPVVIADGHHRYETSLAYRDERVAASTGGDPGAAGAVLVFLVELADHELRVGPIHRLLDGLPPSFDLVAALAPAFEILEGEGSTDIDDLVHRGVLTLVLPDRLVGLRPRPEAFAGVRDLDTSRVDHALAGLPPHALRYQHGEDTILTKVRSGEAQAGILVRPVGVAQILDIAHGGERMPPKTTFFWPKPRTGTVFRLLD